MSLKQKGISSIKWTTLGQVINQSISFVVSVILARLLSPSEFGIMAIAIVFVGIAQVFQGFGFGGSLLQSQKVDKRDFSTIFYFNLLASAFITGIMIILSPYIAIFYKLEILRDIIIVLALNNIVGAFSSMQAIRLQKNLEFKLIVQIEIAVNVLSSSLAISMILFNYEIWGLVFKSVAAALLTTSFYWYFSKWTPLLLFDIRIIRKHWNFSIYLFWTTFFAKVFDEIENLIIGKLYSTSVLGVYSRAKNLQKLPGQIYSTSVTNVLFPMFSKIQNDNDQLKRYYVAIIHFVSFSLIPVYLLIAALSEPLVITLYGEQWKEVSEILFLLCLVAYLNPISAANLNLFLSKGHSKFAFRFAFIKRSISLVLILISVSLGIKTLIYCLMLIIVLGFIANLYYAGRLINFKVLEQVKIIIPYLSFSAFAAYLSYNLHLVLSFNNYLSLPLSSLAALFIYLLLNRVFRLKAIPIIINNTTLKNIRYSHIFVW